MSYTAPANWYRTQGGVGEIVPTFTGWYGVEVRDHTSLSAGLRQAFAFFRRHGDRRYSAQSLIRLLAFADRLDAGVDPSELNALPAIVVAETPFSYDEDTEVKSGGVLGMAVMLPGGRTMIAAHSEYRQHRIGTALLQFMRTYYNEYLIVWVHRQNLAGASFLLSQGLMPWSINAAGAVQYCQRQPVVEETDAVAEESDYVVDELLGRQRRASRNRPSVALPRLDVATSRDRLLDESGWGADLDELYPDGMRPWP